VLWSVPVRRLSAAWVALTLRCSAGSVRLSCLFFAKEKTQRLIAAWHQGCEQYTVAARSEIKVRVLVILRSCTRVHAPVAGACSGHYLRVQAHVAPRGTLSTVGSVGHAPGPTPQMFAKATEAVELHTQLIIELLGVKVRRRSGSRAELTSRADCVGRMGEAAGRPLRSVARFMYPRGAAARASATPMSIDDDVVCCTLQRRLADGELGDAIDATMTNLFTMVPTDLFGDVTYAVRAAFPFPVAPLLLREPAADSRAADAGDQPGALAPQAQAR
jgi:hypothetical protein